MDMRSIYIANGVGIFILLMLQYTSRTKIQRSRPEDRIYSFMVIGVMRRLGEYNGSEPLYPLSLSYGMSFFETGDMDTFMKEMDDNMYRMKAEHHARAESPE